MPKPWQLTQGAEAALVDIARWTIETFGPRQAAAYEEDLITACREIAAGTAHSQDCKRFIDPDLPSKRNTIAAVKQTTISTTSVTTCTIRLVTLFRWSSFATMSLITRGPSKNV
ncbi:type II toxin-antitoxin system RelE/ParE family toxin [Roseovarius sp. SYSU LYC5161]|uniref:type II toxin-antitoxin system RelE/ParE family toxin n=1 Tax=Roseovarius halophilus (ex Wu et al. 2025) TaxID=3376060 RepID=UPI00399C3822